MDNQPKLTPQQNAIMQLSAMMAAIHLETTDPITKQFIAMISTQIASEYEKDSADPLAIPLFTPLKLTEMFRDSMRQMRAGYNEIKVKSKIMPVDLSLKKNGHK